MTDYLDLAEMLHLVERLLGGTGGIRDVGLLESALARPRATAFGSDAYPDVDHKAAALLHSLASNHPLVDGNKRLAWLAMRVFYGINGHELRFDPDDAFELVVAVCEGRVSDVGQIASTLRRWRTDDAG